VDAYSRTAIALGPTKHSLLYFDYVIPLRLQLDLIADAAERVLPDSIEIDSLPLRPLWDEILPPNLRSGKFKTDFLPVIKCFTVSAILNHSDPQLDYSDRKDFAKDFGVEYDTMDDKLYDLTKYLLSKYNLGSCPIDDCGPEDYSKNQNSDPAIVLSNLQLINVTDTSWEKILEFRKDKTSRQKLRRLRLFAYNNYEGKDQNYIEDDVAQRIEDYNAVVRKWQFETHHSAINTLLGSKTLAHVLTGSFIAALLGAPITASLTAASGFALEIGRSLLEIRKRRFELNNALADNPISYIVYAKSKLADENG